MFAFVANEQLLADWVLHQHRADGLFPPSKGWSLKFKLYEPRGLGRPLFLFEAHNEQEKLALLPLSPLSGEVVFKELAGLAQGLSQLVVLSGESFADQVTSRLERIALPAAQLSLGEKGMELASGEFKNSRLEFRLLKNPTVPGELPQNMPLNPGLLEDEAILARCIHALLAQLNDLWLSGGAQAQLESTLDGALPLYSALTKAQRKQATETLAQQLTQLCAAGPLKDWLTIELYKKKPQSQPVWRLKISGPPENRAALLAVLRKQDQALHLLRTQSQQISYYERETDPF